VPALAQELGQDMRLDLDPGDVRPQHRQRGAVAVAVGQHRADERHLAGEPGFGQQVQRLRRVDRERRGRRVRPTVPGDLERCGRHRCPQQLREARREAELALAEPRLVPAHGPVEPLLQEVGVAAVEPIEEGPELAALACGERRGGVRGDQHHGHLRLGQPVAQGGVGLGLGRHVEQEVDADGAHARRLQSLDHLAQERPVDRRAAREARQRVLGDADDDDVAVLRLGRREPGEEDVVHEAAGDRERRQPRQGQGEHDGGGDDEDHRPCIAPEPRLQASLPDHPLSPPACRHGASPASLAPAATRATHAAGRRQASTNAAARLRTASALMPGL
jgi:hypothetical protein